MRNRRQLAIGITLLLVFGQVVVAAEEKDEHTSGVDKALLGAAIAFVGAYSVTIAADHVIDNSVNFNETYIPVAGPFLAIAHYDDKVSPDYAGRNLDKAGFALSGVVQAASVAVIAVRLARRGSGGRADRVPVVFVGPMGHRGFIASCAIRF